MYRMNPTLLRLEAMDAQRFDLSQRGNPANRITSTVAPSEESGTPQITTLSSEWQQPANLTISTVAPSVHREESGIPQITTLSSETDETDETSTMKECGSANDDATSSSQTVEATIFTFKNETQLTDTFERDGYTTTRTIIIPQSQSPTLSIFSRPSTPIPGGISRPSSPFGTMLTNLNCMGSTDAFEEQLESILQWRKNDLASVIQEMKVQVTQETKVEVTQEQTVSYRETWGDAQWWYPAACLLSGTLPPGTAHRPHIPHNFILVDTTSLSL